MDNFSDQLTFEQLVDFFGSSKSSLENRMSASLYFSSLSHGKSFGLVPSQLLAVDGCPAARGEKTLKFRLIDEDLNHFFNVYIYKYDAYHFLLVTSASQGDSMQSLWEEAAICAAQFVTKEFSNCKIFISSSQNVDSVDFPRVFDNFEFFIDVQIQGDQEIQSAFVEIQIPSDSQIPDLILTAGPSISILESLYVQDATNHGWNSKHSDYISRFEREFANYVGARYAMATSSCSGALHLALLSLGIGAGDEVIVPDITWVATASAVRYVGATPIFADVDPETWTLNLVSLQQKISDRTKAIIPVHLYGFGAPMQEIMDIAKTHGLYVVEDAAPAIGTQIGNKKAGTYGDFGCYSFQGAKLLVTGEGGMIVSDNEELIAKARKIQDHGRKPGTFWIEELGYKYKMNNITAALGLAQIQRADNQINVKREIADMYRQGLSDLHCLKFQQEFVGTKSIHWMNSFYLTSESQVRRDELIFQLKQAGIDSRPVFPSISQYEIWGYSPEIPKISKLIGDNGINLPSGVGLKKATIEKVIVNVRRILD